MQPNADLLEELKNRILNVTNPLKIILFGSAARGDMSSDSDLDILIVLQDGTNCGQVVRRIYRNLIGFNAGADIIAVTETDLSLYGNKFGLVYYSAQQEGREIYAA